MGAGDQLAGDEDAGDDIVHVVPAARVVPAFLALTYDPVTKDYPVDESGFYIPLHPVDARVTLHMTVAAKSIKGSPDLGNQLRAIKYITPGLVTEVRYEVRRVLKSEVDAKNIRIETIDVEVPNPGAIAVLLRYVNLRLEPRAGKARNPVTLRVLANG